MRPAATVTVEFFGIPRRRAGLSELTVEADMLAQVLAAVQRACPGLTGLVQPDGRLAPHYLLSVDGRRFVSEPGEPLLPGERLLLLSADAGG